MKRFVLVIWVLFHLLFLSILVDHADPDPVIAGRYSTAYALVLGLIALSGLIGVVVLLLGRPFALPRWLHTLRSHRTFNAAVLVVSTALMLAVWLIPFQVPMPAVQRELLRGYATGAILAGLYLALFWCGPDPYVPWRVWKAVAVIVGAGAVIIAVHYIDRFPQLNTIDELHNWVVQWTYANTGLLGDALYRQMIPLPQPIYDSPHYPLGLLLRFIGDTFWQARVARLLMACLALPFIYLCGRRMYGPRAGLFAVVLAIILNLPTNYVRPDVFVGVMLAVALYVYLRAQTTRRPWMHYLTGLCIALAGEGHPLAYRFGLTFALLYLVRWVYEMWQARRLSFDGRLFALALGGFTGLLIYLSIHIIPGWQQGIHFAANYGPFSRTGAEQLQAEQNILPQQFEVWMSTSPLELLLLMLGIAAAISEFNSADRLLLALIAVSELLMMATYGYYRQFYQAHYLPIFALMIGRVLANLTGLHDSRIRAGRLSGLALAAVILVVTLANLTQSAQAATNDPTRTEFTAIARQLKADLPPNAVVVGNEDYFLEIRSLNYYGVQTVTTNGWFLVNYQGYKLWEVTRPDIFILSGGNLDVPRYTDLSSIYQYMNDNGFQLARCYTETGLIEARVYVHDMPPGWKVDYDCQRYGWGTGPTALLARLNLSPESPVIGERSAAAGGSHTAHGTLLATLGG